ncbi:hypothetical protein C1H46_023476 [Malus baccata]|uniref:Uncharacterized protein n=1 Tax=Malus baccata TaxID=106549 RepID=A0A540LWS9_MALBA|nr:hypothetical protein C1H46_023476 [Malus baccata]
MAGTMLSPGLQPLPAMARSQSLCFQQSQSLQESRWRFRSFPYTSGEVADYSPDNARAAFQALMKRFDSLNTEENPNRLPLLGKGFGDDNSTYYKEHNQTTGSDDYNPSESLLPSDSPHAYTDYDKRVNVATGSDDSNRSESLLPSVSSHANTNYGEQGNVANVEGSDDSNLSESLLPSVSPQANMDFGEPGNQTTTMGLSIVVDVGDENNDFDHQLHGTRVTLLQWIFMLNGLSLEMLSAYFDQLSSPNKSHYALVSLLLAIAAVLTCILELIHNGIKEGVESTNGMVFGTLPDIFGLGLSLIQCLCSAVQYHFLHRHENNPMKLSPVPLFFFCCLVVLKLKMN